MLPFLTLLRPCPPLADSNCYPDLKLMQKNKMNVILLHGKLDQLTVGLEHTPARKEMEEAIGSPFSTKELVAGFLCRSTCLNNFAVLWLVLLSSKTTKNLNILLWPVILKSRPSGKQSCNLCPRQPVVGSDLHKYLWFLFCLALFLGNLLQKDLLTAQEASRSKEVTMEHIYTVTLVSDCNLLH